MCGHHSYRAVQDIPWFSHECSSPTHARVGMNPSINPTDRSWDSEATVAQTLQRPGPMKADDTLLKIL